jgi:hypothetical protein
VKDKEAGPHRSHADPCESTEVPGEAHGQDDQQPNCSDHQSPVCQEAVVPCASRTYSVRSLQVTLYLGFATVDKQFIALTNETFASCKFLVQMCVS